MLESLAGKITALEAVGNFVVDESPQCFFKYAHCLPLGLHPAQYGILIPVLLTSDWLAR